MRQAVESLAARTTSDQKPLMFGRGGVAAIGKLQAADATHELLEHVAQLKRLWRGDVHLRADHHWR
ncbi:hypothetical protein [Actinoplanes sp. NPDC049802]|uniref:hypothetical protein n=1 Tax=Actinoplanes sp. NPDC049802 TaxID=3154742 RepID=UPI0033F15CF1